MRAVMSATHMSQVLPGKPSCSDQISKRTCCEQGLPQGLLGLTATGSREVLAGSGSPWLFCQAEAPLQVRWAKRGSKRKKKPRREDRTEEQKAGQAACCTASVCHD